MFVGVTNHSAPNTITRINNPTPLIQAPIQAAIQAPIQAPIQAAIQAAIQAGRQADLQKALLVEEVGDIGDYLGAHDELATHALVHDEVQVALSKTGFLGGGGWWMGGGGWWMGGVRLVHGWRWLVDGWCMGDLMMDSGW